MPQRPKRDSAVLRPALEPLEPRVLLDGSWWGQAAGPFGGDGIELEYDPAWIAQPPEPPGDLREGEPPGPAASEKDWTGVLDVYVEQGLLASIQGSIDTYVADLTAEGYTVSVQEWSGPAEALRDHLRVRHETAGLEGTLFVGDLPTLTYTNANDFNGQTATFVHDLYFMDLDGTYVLNDTIPDEHYDGSGDITPEIYVSRITTSTITALTGRSEVELIDRYFAKAHGYRAGTLTYEHRGILWSDNDWRYTDYFMAGDDLYEDVLNIRDDAETTRQSYIDCLGLDYESIMFMAHSGVTSHSIQSPGGGTITNAQIRDLNPREGFYNLWNCSSGRFTVPGNLICTYVYSGDYGLNAVGTTKTGSMLASYYYYQHQGLGLSTGQAFQLWWSDAGINTDSLKRWHYGMTMQGDPTLRPATMGDARLLADAGNDQQVSPGQEVTLNGSGTYVVEGGEPTWLWEQLSGPAVSIDNADRTIATFTPAEMGDYVFSLTVQLGEVVSTDEVTVTAVVATPTSVDLLPASDTGGADDDDLTRLDNSGPDTTLRFLVAGTIPGAVVTLYADGAAVGAAVADGETTLVVTGGVHALADGVRSITARQREPSQDESPDSAALAVEIDTQAPQVVSACAAGPTHVTVELDGPLNVATAEAAENYRLNHDAIVTSAATGGDPGTVGLTLAQPMVEAWDYTLTINNVEDLAGNRIAAGTQAEVRAADPSLLVWWRFDETEGAVAADASGNGRNGEVVGATWAPEGRIGGALYFHGDVDYTYVLDDDAEDYLNGLGAITVAMWIKSEETGTERGFFTTRDPPDKECMSMRYNDRGANGGADDTMKAYVQTTVDKHRTEGQEDIQTTDWQHVAMTWTSESTILLYADGAPQHLSYDEGSLGGATSGTEKLLVGTAYKRTDGDWWGLIDDFRIYERALDAGEIAALANLDPLALDDPAYQVDQGHSLTVDAPGGVLANDTDPDDGPQALTASLLAEPENGAATLNPDGSFEYTPAAGYWGTDAFVYRAYDGLEYSSPATVTITVRDTVAPTIEAWHSLARHANGVGDALLEIPDDGTFSEPRAAGVARLMVEFSEPIDPTSFTPASVLTAGNGADGLPVDLSGVGILASLAEGGTAGIIDFVPALPDVARYRVRIVDVTDAAGNPATGDSDRVFTALAGDATGDLRVNAIDLSYIWPRRTEQIDGVTPEQTRSDVNVDGRVNAIDLSAAWPRRGANMQDVSDPELPSAPRGATKPLGSPGRDRPADVLAASAWAVGDAVAEPVLRPGHDRREKYAASPTPPAEPLHVPPAGARTDAPTPQPIISAAETASLEAPTAEVPKAALVTDCLDVLSLAGLLPTAL